MQLQACMKTKIFLSILFTSLKLKAVTVAVIDTGVDFSHQQIVAHKWLNSKEIPGNGIDDDGNGFVDDVNGWDFANNSGQITDPHGHGTHVSGIITDIASDVKIMSLRYYEQGKSAENALEFSIRALKYAVDNGADIINYSGGGGGYSFQEKAILQQAWKKNILVVCAAGNFSQNADTYPFYPAAYHLPNIIVVASVDSNKQLLPSSNYGVQTVDIAAPGENIYSSLPGNKFGMMTGTSQATAFVTGTAAAMLSKKPKLNVEVLKQILIQSGDSSMNLKSKIRNPKSLNVRQALTSVAD